MTELLYLKEFDRLSSSATVRNTYEKDGRVVIILDRTIFYPQGGGQPYDQGTISSPNGKFIVEEVRFMEEDVYHIGHIETGTVHIRNQVALSVQKERRTLHARIHSAGHLVDKAVTELKLPWIPGKGYHFPNGPYDEYQGSLVGRDKEVLKKEIEDLCNGYIQKGGRTEVIFMSREEMKEKCHYTPDFSEEKGERARIVVHDGFYMPCGGTPVRELSEIGKMTIRKIKQESDHIRIGYDVEK